MQHRLTKLRARRAAGEHGFTLIELLVVVVIIGILIAIAIPVYLNYEKGAKDKSAASDLRNAVAVLELCKAENSTFPSKMKTNGEAPEGCDKQWINLTPGTSIAYYPGTSAGGSKNDSYLATTTNSGGSGKVYCYASAAGGSVAVVKGKPPREYAFSCAAAGKG